MNDGSRSGLRGRPLGVMQGRLLPKHEGRYQAHPVGRWRDEFALAAAFRLDYIEFILDYDGVWENPLLAPGGVEAITAVAAETGVRVLSICADYFMEAPLHSMDVAQVAESREVLSRLVDRARELCASDIVIPCVDQSRLEDDVQLGRLVDNLEPLVDQAEQQEVNFSLETDLPPEQFAGMLDRFPSKRVTVNYDIGNSASLGFSPEEEFRCYGDRISVVHIKDRTCGGGSVKLGTGAADLAGTFARLKNLDFGGVMTMQAYRDDEGITVFREQLEFVRNLWDA